MFCVKCGKELPEGANVCPNCGERVEKEVSFEDVKAYAGQKAEQASQAIQGQAQQASTNLQGKYEEFMEERSVAKGRRISALSDMFVRADEEQKAVIGGGYLANLLSGGGLSKGFGVLTNRRVYYRGKSYYKLGGKYVRTKEDCTVDLRDVSSTGFTHMSRIWLLILVALSFLVLVIFPLIRLYAALVFVIGLIEYFILPRTIYNITFAGGSLGINVSFFGINNVIEFDKALHRVKDECLAEDRQSDRGKG